VGQLFVSLGYLLSIVKRTSFRRSHSRSQIQTLTRIMIQMKLTANRKTFLLFLIATTASFVLEYSGRSLAYYVMKSKGLDTPSEYVRLLE
jgi:hypothetical protein